MTDFTVSPGQPIRASHVNQFSRWLTAVTKNHTTAITNTHATEYALTLTNEVATGNILKLSYGTGTAVSATFGATAISLVPAVTVTGALSALSTLAVTGVATAASWPITARNQSTAAGAGAFRLLDAAGTTAWVLFAKATATSPYCFAINPVSQTAAENSLFLINASSSSSYVAADFSLTLTGSGADSGALRAIASQSTNASNGYRAGEFQVLRQSGATAGGTWGIEVGVHAAVIGAASTHNLGIFLSSHHNGWQASGTRADAAVYITGEDGWQRAIDFRDTDSSTTLFSVDQTGGTLTGNVFPRSSGAWQCGLGTFPWLVVNTDFLSVTTNGSTAAPCFNRFGDGTRGVLFTTTGVGISVAGAGGFRVESTGVDILNAVSMRQLTSAAATAAAGYVKMFAQTTGDMYTIGATGTASKMALVGSTAFAAGATNSPTYATAVYTTIPDMSITMATASGSDIIVDFAGAFLHSSSGGAIELALSLDGAAEVGAFSITHRAITTPIMQTAMYRFSEVSATTHIIAARWLTSPATATANGVQRYLRAIELRK